MMIARNHFIQVVLGNEILQGLRQNEFSLHYQPQYSFNGNIYGVEALARWHKNNIEWISPLRFIPLAEESGHIWELGDWALHSALRQLHVWKNLGLFDLKMSVNVSTAQITRYDFPVLISTYLEEFDIHPQSLTLEITETDFFEHFKGNFHCLSVLNEMGVNLALDDFGIGHSSLQWLAELPVSILKIDRSFVRGLVFESTRSVVRNLFQMASDLDLEIIAEGIESESERAILNGFGSCRYQGFLMGKPRDAVSITSDLLDHFSILAR
jgi:EAL domain-containing protein (putative c-di-GMP-specific phosphodiesterase class I)